jgi:hypothetical protein
MRTRSPQPAPARTAEPRKTASPRGTRLRVNAPGDVYEHQAHRLTDVVLSRATGAVNVPALPDPSSNHPIDAARDVVDAALDTTGAPLQTDVQQQLNPVFSHHLSRVRVHADERADAAAAALHARAFTHGSDIFLRRGEGSPDTAEGRRLLAHELSHVLQRPPSGLLLRDAESDVDPQAKLSAAALGRWKQLYSEMGTLLRQLGQAEAPSPSVERKGWINQLGGLIGRLGTVDNETSLAEVTKAYQSWEIGVRDAAANAATHWLAVKDDYHTEVGRILDEPTMQGMHALDFITGIYATTKGRIDRTGLDLLCDEDFIELESTLDEDKHLWYGELKVARERSAELTKMLDVVGALRGAGSDEDKLVPGWDDRIYEEAGRLSALAKGATKQTTRVEFEKLEKELWANRSRALAMKPRKKGIAEKAFLAIKGAITAVIDPLIEAGKQVVDLGQIAVHFLSFTHYKPKFVSDVGKAAEKGATTTELLEGMVKGLLETPERLWNAILKDDWEAIGKETANLYMLAKTGKAGAAKAAPWIALVRARAAGLRGGMAANAALAVLKIARETKLVIRFRMTGKSALGLRAKGHPAKPEFMKMKSINDIDVHLGAKKADIGKVGYFEPKLPANIEKLGADLQTQIRARHAKRVDEFNQYRGDVAQWKKSGLVEQKGQTLVDPTSGKAFTSDYDLFDIRKGTTAGRGIEFESLPRDVRMRLEAKPIEAQHGAHLDWREIPAGQAAGYAEIILNARPKPGAQPLIEFHPDGRIRYTYFVD